jgi:hypothetical protein
MRGIAAVEVRSKARRNVGAVVQLDELQIQLSGRRVRSRACERPPRRPDDGGREGQGEVKTPGHGRRAKQRNLDAFGLDCGVGRPRGNGVGHGVFDMVLPKLAAGTAITLKTRRALPAGGLRGSRGPEKFEESLSAPAYRRVTF